MTSRLTRARERVVWSRAYQVPARTLAGDRARPFLVTVGHEPAFVWFQIPKVASRTIRYHLFEHSDLSFRSGSRLLPPSVLRGRYTFAFVRNPWDRLVSAWADKVVRRDTYGLPDDVRASFPLFVRWIADTVDLATADRHIRHQHVMVDRDIVDFVGRFETFSRDFDAVCRRLGLPPCEDRRNASPHDSYERYYDRELAALVGRLYAEDVEAFGYEAPTP